MFDSNALENHLMSKNTLLHIEIAKVKKEIEVKKMKNNIHFAAYCEIL